jgi:hypothetical protein
VKNPLGKLAAFTAAAVVLSGSAQAALFDRGGGMIYDDVLKITWLQDASYARTSGYDADGLMSWQEASLWAENLVYGGFDDWRLPSVAPINGVAFDYSTASYDGKTDTGARITSENAEMSHLFYVTLGNDAAYTADGQGFTPCAYLAPDICLQNRGPFLNLLTAKYWYGQPYERPFGPPLAGFYWDFNFMVGVQAAESGSQYFSGAWAVRDGDVRAAVPEPRTLALSLMGISAVFAVRRRRR